MLENTGMTGAYPITSPAMDPEPNGLITADNEYRHEALDPAKAIGSMQYGRTTTTSSRSGDSRTTSMTNSLRRDSRVTLTTSSS